MNKRKQARRERALDRLYQHLVSYKEKKYTFSVEYIEKDIKILKDRLAGIKKPVKTKSGAVVVNGKKEDRWFIDIYNISYSRVKRSERRKNKGKSRKKMRTQKTVSLLKTVTAQDGMITSYREGRMGLSPKNHKFILRRDVPSYFN